VDMERQFAEYVQEAERRIQHFVANSSIPIRKDESLLPVPNIKIRKPSEL